jgi:hypothetical protein
MLRHRFSFLLLSVIVCLAMPSSVQARLRPIFEDYQIVERSELIVVGAIKEGSIKYVEHDNGGPDYSPTWEHQAILIVREVLKGTCDEKEISLVIHYGLDPEIDGKLVRHGIILNQNATAGAAHGAIQIEDTANSMRGGPPLTVDARQDHMWFLRRLSGQDGEIVGTGSYGIKDPQDVATLSMKPFARCLLDRNPEAAVRQQMAADSTIAARAMRFLDHCEIERIKPVPDVDERAQRLIPYFLSSEVSYEAEKALKAIGPEAGPYLMAVYQRSRDAEVRRHVIGMWGSIRWPGCADILIQLLKTGSDHQHADGEILLLAEPSPDKEMDFNNAATTAIWTLGEIGEVKAIEAIEMNRSRWASMGAGYRNSVETCDGVLKRLKAARAATQPGAAPPEKQ